MPLTAEQFNAMGPEERARIAKMVSGQSPSVPGLPDFQPPKNIWEGLGNIWQNQRQLIGEKYGTRESLADRVRRFQIQELRDKAGQAGRVGAYFNNLTPEQAQKIGLSPAQLALVRANPQASYDDVVDRSFKREIFSTTPHYGFTATGSRIAYQLGDAGSANILNIDPGVEFEQIDKGSHILIYEKGTRTLLETIPKKMTPDQTARLVIEKDQKTKGDTERISARAKGLRQEFNQITSSMRDVALSYGKIKSAEKAASDQDGKNGKRKGAADIALIFNYMKLLDPGSVVREGEFATARNAGGVPDRVIALYNGVMKGDLLSDEVRTSFVAAAEEVLKPYRDQFHATKIRYSNLAKSEGIEPDRVVMNDPFSGLAEIKYTKDWYTKHGFTPSARAK
mgnify:CR=1 FL=1